MLEVEMDMLLTQDLLVGLVQKDGVICWHLDKGGLIVVGLASFVQCLSSSLCSPVES